MEPEAIVWSEGILAKLFRYLSIIMGTEDIWIMGQGSSFLLLVVGAGEDLNKMTNGNS